MNNQDNVARKKGIFFNLSLSKNEASLRNLKIRRKVEMFWFHWPQVYCMESAKQGFRTT